MANDNLIIPPPPAAPLIAVAGGASKLYTAGQSTILPAVDVQSVHEPVEVTLQVASGQGTLSLSQTAPAAITVTGAGSPDMKVSGAAAAVNATLVTAQYNSPVGETSDIDIKVSVKDSQNNVSTTCGGTNGGITLISTSANKTASTPSATVCIKGTNGSVQLFFQEAALHPNPVLHQGSIGSTLTALATAINSATTTPPITASANTSALTLTLTINVKTDVYNGKALAIITTGDMGFDSACPNKFSGGKKAESGDLSDWFDNFLENDLMNLVGQAAGTFATGLLFSHILPNEADVQIKLPASLFEEENEVKIAFLVQGKVIKVPNVYNAATNTYTGEWDGSTFIEAVSECPAWVFRDYLLSKRYGAGNDLPLTPTQLATLDQDLYRISKYCNQKVSDGKGGVEPRYTLNVVIQPGMTKIEALQAICSCFNGQMVAGGFGIRVFADMPTATSLLVNQTSMSSEGCAYSGGSLKNMYNIARVKWNNPAKFYALDYTQAEDRTSVFAAGEKAVEETAFGCSSAGQAIRKGKWILSTEKANPLLVTYRAGMDHARIIPGMVVMLEDSDISLNPRSGRVKAVTGAVVDFDAPTQAGTVSGQTYSMHVSMPDGTIAVRTIIGWQDAAGNATTGLAYKAVLDAPLPQTPVPFAVYNIVGSSGAYAPKLFRVLKIAEHKDIGYEVTGQAYYVDKYAEIEADINASA